VPDAALLLEPLPGGVLFYHPTQFEPQRFLFVSGARVRALEHARTAGGSTPRDLSQQMVDISTGLAAAGERPSLEKRAHALAVSHPRPLRILEELIEESQLRGGIRLKWLHGKVFERNRHALPGGVQSDVHSERYHAARGGTVYKE
jgi:hypothetical protein